MSSGPFSLHVIMCFIDLISVTMFVSLIYGNALFHTLCRHSPDIIQSSVFFVVVLKTYTSEILLVVYHWGSQSPWHDFNMQ